MPFRRAEPKQETQALTRLAIDIISTGDAPASAGMPLHPAATCNAAAIVTTVAVSISEMQAVISQRRVTYRRRSTDFGRRR